jgi:hypothetical protein
MASPGSVLAPTDTASESTASRAPTAATIALTVAVACGCMLVLIPAALLLDPGTPSRGLFAALGHRNQSVKTALYVVAFLVLVPGAVLLVPRVADRLAAGRNGQAVGLLASGLWLALCAVIIAAHISARLPWGDGLGVALVAACCWWLLALAIVWRALRPQPWPLLLAGARNAPAVTVAAGVATALAVLCVTRLHGLPVTALVVGAVGAIGSVEVYRRFPLRSLSARNAAVVEVLIVALLFLCVPDLVIFEPSRTPFLTVYNHLTIAAQENYLLGPANQLIHGGTMLVNTVSQYGVGSIYFLAGWFHLAPIGYGTVGFLDGILTGLTFVASYYLLRLAGVSRLLASTAMALGVIALLYNLTFPVGALAEHGPLRFGLPLAALVAVAGGLRSPRRAAPARWSLLLVIAVASIWSIEAFAYTVFTLASMAAIMVASSAPEVRLRWLRGWALAAVFAVVVAQLTLAGATLVATGQLPDWGQYFAYFNNFIFGGLANVSYPFARWSPGLAVGALYLSSAIATTLVIARIPSVRTRESRAMIAIGGTTAYGIALYSYFDNRSSTYLLLYVALPALLTGVLWLSLLLRLSRRAMPVAGPRVLAFALTIAIVVLAAAWSPISARFSDSALAYIVPGGPSLRSALHRLWHPSALDPRAPEGQRLLARYMPGQNRSLVLTLDSGDLETEILIRSQRGNLLPIGDSVEESLVPSAREPVLRSAIAGLHVGERLLINRTAQTYLGTLRSRPSYDPLAGPHPNLVSGLEEWVLSEIARRFELRKVYDDRRGFIVEQLEPHVG